MGKLIETHLIMGLVCEGHPRIYNWGHKLYICQQDSRHIIQDCYGLIVAESDRTHLWPVGRQKISRGPSGRGFYNTFPKISVGRDNSTTQRCFFVAMRP